MLYITVLVALIVAIYIYHCTKKTFMLFIIAAQVLFFIGLLTDRPALRESAHFALYLSILYGIFFARHIFILGYILTTVVFTLLTRIYLKKCAFRLMDHARPPSCAFPPDWLPLPPLNISLTIVTGILVARIFYIYNINEEKESSLCKEINKNVLH